MLFRTRGRKKRSKRSKRKEKEKIIIRKIKRENEEAKEDRIVCHIDTGIKIIFVFTGFVFVL
jgi:tartrate dehydratase alpha subunit/fumarate hydratase class I-like protein